MRSTRVFYTLVVTQMLSMIGSRMSGIAIGIYLFTTTGATAPLLLFSLFNELPAMLGSSFAGVFVDRVNRKRVLIISDAGQAVGSLLLMLSFASGDFQLWHLYAVGLFQGICSMFQGPAKDAVVAVLVPDAHRDRANAIQAATFPLAGVVAPALTGALFGLVGITGIIIIDLLTFLAAVSVIALLSIPDPPQTDEGRGASGSWWQEWRGGLAFLRARPALLVLVFYLTVLNFLLNGPLELTIPYLISITGSEEITGAVLAVNSLGGVAGAALLAARGRVRRRVHAAMRAYLLVGVMFLVFATARHPILLAAALFTLIAGLQVWAVMNSIFQAKTPPDMQGRIFSIIGQLGYLGSTTSFLITGALVDHVLTPMATSPAWDSVALLVGSGQGGAMALVQLVTGLVILILTGAVYALPRVRRIEQALPDFVIDEAL